MSQAQARGVLYVNTTAGKGANLIKLFQCKLQWESEYQTPAN